MPAHQERVISLVFKYPSRDIFGHLLPVAIQNRDAWNETV